MNSQEQINLVRSIYIKIRERYYEKRFRIMLLVLLKKNPDYYTKRVDFIYSLMQVAENALVRGEISRGLRYVSCFQKAINSLEGKMIKDCRLYFNNIPIE